MNRQIRILGVGLLACFLAVFVQLNRVQVFDQEALQDDPLNTRATVRDWNRPRGSIFTIDGTVAATSVAVEGGPFERVRTYPEGDLYAHSVGWFSFQLGADGLERTYTEELAGRTATQRFDSLGSLLGDDDTTADLTMTIHHDVQRVARDALGDRRGSVVALDPRTGAVLALWSNPSFDPGALGSGDPAAAQALWDGLEALPDADDPRLARTYREIYFPGSTFKVVTAAAAIDSGAANFAVPTFEPTTEYVAPLTTVPLRNFGGGRCGGTMLEAFVVSCNTVFAQLGAELVGAGPMVEVARRFGFNDAPPLDVPRPAASVFPTDYGAEIGVVDSDVAVEGGRSVPLLENTPALAQASIGQYDVKASPLQMALVAAGVANDGAIMTPHLLHELRDQRGDLVDRYEPRVWRTPLSRTEAEQLRTAMERVVAVGTARGLAIAGMTVGGKTGTAQIDASRPDDTHAWIIGYAGPPGQAPTVAVAVLLESVPAAGQLTGGVDAAPIARAVMEAVLDAQAP